MRDRKQDNVEKWSAESLVALSMGKEGRYVSVFSFFSFVPCKPSKGREDVETQTFENKCKQRDVKA